MSRLRISPSLIVACLALFISLTGAGVAVVSALPRNSVGTAQLKANAVNSSKVKDGSLGAVDFASGQLPAGPTGPKGDAAATNAVLRTDNGGGAASRGSVSTVTVRCAEGERAIGGGFAVQAENQRTPVSVKANKPSGAPPDRWVVAIQNISDTAIEDGSIVAEAYVVCVSP